MFLAQAVGLPIDPAQLNIIAIGRCAFTLTGTNAVVGVRNFGLAIGPATSSAGLYTVTWNTFVSGTNTVGAFGTNTDLPPMLYFQMGSAAANIHGLAWPEGINATGATIRIVQASHGITATSAVNAGPVVSAMSGTMFVIPCQAVIASAFTCVTAVSTITGA